MSRQPHANGLIVETKAPAAARWVWQPGHRYYRELCAGKVETFPAEVLAQVAHERWLQEMRHQPSQEVLDRAAAEELRAIYKRMGLDT